MTNRSGRMLAVTTDHAPLVTLGLVLLTGLALLGYVAPDFLGRGPFGGESGPRENAPPRATAPRVVEDSPLSASEADVVLVVESDSFFTPEGSRAIRGVVESLRELDVVADLFWLDDVPAVNVFSLRDSVFPRSTASVRQFDRARSAAVDDPLIGGRLLSEDGRTLLLLVRLDWLFVESDEQCTELIRRTAREAADAGDVEMSFLITGRVPGYLAFQRSRSENQTRFQVIGYGMVLVMAVVLFRGFGAVLIVAAAPAAGVFWTLGLLRFANLQDNPFNEIVLPVLISMVGFTDGVHLMVEIRRRRAAGESTRDAARGAVEKIGPACFLTSLTTAIGLGALALAHHEIVREFGWSCVLGVVVMFVSVVTVIPLLCRTPLATALHRGHGRGFAERSLSRLQVVIDAVLARRRTVAAVAIVGTLACVGISAQLRPDERVANVLPTDSEAARALAHLDRAMGGTEPGRVSVRWTGNVSPDSEEILDVVRRVDDLLRGEELIGRPLSMRNFVDVLPGDPDAAGRMSVVELLPPPIRRGFYRPADHEANVDFRVRDLGIATYGPVFARIEAELVEIAAAHPEFTLTLDGQAVRRWRNLHQIVVDLALSLGSASLVIFVVLALAYRSLRLGLIAVFPNVFPLALTGTFLVLTGQSLELASVCAFTVCLGIAVDDTIHFLTRYVEERERQGEEDAIRSAFVATGTALVMTTVILVVGISTVWFSGLREQRIFASMAAMTIGSALVGDLVLLPPLLALFRGRSAPVQPESRADDTIARE